MASRETDVVVVGGGILGHLVTRQLALTTSSKVRFIRLNDSDRPRAASKRNHGWDQSGLFYYEEDKEAAAMMSVSSLNMHSACGLSRCEERGIIGVATPAEAQRLQGSADALFQEIEPVSGAEAERQLQHFFNRDYLYFYVPDTRLDQPRLMTALRRQMSELTERVEFLELSPDKAVLIQPEPAAPGKFLLKAGEEIIDAPIVLICAGYMIPAMFNRAGIKHPLAGFISPLLRVPAASMIRVPLYVDMSSSLSLLTQLSGGTTYNIIGNRERRPHQPEHSDDLSVTPDEQDSVIELLPPSWQLIVRAGHFPFTAGPKVEPVGPKGERLIKPWVFDASRVTDFSGLWASVPVKATNAWWAMELLLQSAGLLVQSKDLPIGAGLNYSLAGSYRSERARSSWGIDRMHWEYEKLDDREKNRRKK